MEKEIVLEEIKKFISYALKEGIINEELTTELVGFANYYIRNIKS